MHLFSMKAISVTWILNYLFSTQHSPDFHGTFTGHSRDFHGTLLYYNPIVTLLRSYMIPIKDLRTRVAVNNFKSLINRFENSPLGSTAKEVVSKGIYCREDGKTWRKKVIEFQYTVLSPPGKYSKVVFWDSLVCPCELLFPGFISLLFP